MLGNFFGLFSHLFSRAASYTNSNTK